MSSSGKDERGVLSYRTLQVVYLPVIYNLFKRRKNSYRLKFLRVSFVPMNVFKTWIHSGPFEPVLEQLMVPLWLQMFAHGGMGQRGDTNNWRRGEGVEAHPHPHPQHLQITGLCHACPSPHLCPVNHSQLKEQGDSGLLRHCWCCLMVSVRLPALPSLGERRDTVGRG